MAVGEAITNLLAAPIELDRVKLSCNWMAACSDDPAAPGDDAALYDTVKAVGMELCPALGIGVPVGKDSLSMRTRWREGGEAKQVTAPVSLVVTAFASIDDVRPAFDAAARARRHDARPRRPRPRPHAHGRLDARAGDRPVRRRGARPRRAAAAEGARRRDHAAARRRPRPRVPRPQRRRPVGGGVRDGVRRPPRRQPQRRPARHRERRHRRQPRRVRRREELGRRR